MALPDVKMETAIALSAIANAYTFNNLQNYFDFNLVSSVNPIVAQMECNCKHSRHKKEEKVGSFSGPSEKMLEKTGQKEKPAVRTFDNYVRLNVWITTKKTSRSSALWRMPLQD